MEGRWKWIRPDKGEQEWEKLRSRESCSYYPERKHSVWKMDRWEQRASLKSPVVKCVKRNKNGERNKRMRTWGRKEMLKSEGRKKQREEGWPTSCLHGWLHLYPNIPTCPALPLRAKSASSIQSAVAFYHLAVGQNVHEGVCQSVYLCLHVCESKHERAHTRICLYMCVCACSYRAPHYAASLIYLQTDSSFVSSLTHLLSHPSLHSFSPSCSPSSIHLLNTTQSIQPFLTKFISSSIHFSSFHVPIPQSAFTSRRDTQFPQSHWGGRISDLIHPPLVWCVQASEEEVRGSMEDREREAAEAKL